MRAWRPAHGKPLVCCRWLDADASAPTTAFTEDEIAAVHTTTPMESYGLLLRQDATGVTLMTEYYVDNGQATFRGRTFIPAFQLVSVDVLRQPPAPRRPRSTPPADPSAPSPTQTVVPTR